ncbi:GNAT family N-acetyltransferase [Bacillus luteolus]|uniref:GNAT family N-acetyltransferase n=1 Tax=Litchfieldia luteola TaxID=682179 RepID=A0ABR9QFI4_9BACI|nr:GNAT family N-acetyltransferase [Cytobacillus luteolus]MBE4907249.1 GNAT family N-acetyltransferase [Cytobacillus luteolus]MBP1943274.1 RimJ/RimL family protein N-acetyltransferase [Cytobacillus luteolus]
MTTIQLGFYKPEYQTIVEDYYLPPEQQEFTALPSDALEACETDSERHPVVILYANQPAGFFVLHDWEGVKTYSDNQDAILLRAYSVNHLFQGKGIAKKSLEILPPFVKEHFPKKREIILAVNHGNSVAQHLYQKAGFVDKGIRVMVRKGEQFVFHMNLK